ncbi:COG4223 family protein [Rhizobium sp. KVB221]|uniref:COG4223 family protein n=1 Tax=Rhizobium setariae TaxID=2801340 RepID=A0A937CM98_9HYPH|nr:mitofilin family membrane protein [Rhizobium setariae]MBL0374060.1 COG4223 family protein [Rhizobium setariae]
MKTDPTRHSRPNDDPKTIDLAAGEVKDIAVSEAEGTEEDVSASSAAEGDASAASEATATTTNSDDRRFAEPTRPASGGGSLSLIAAGLIGGAVVLGGAAGLQYWGVFPSLNSDDKTAQTLNLLSAEIEGLKTSIKTVEAAKPDVDLTPVTEKIAALEKRMADVPAANGLSVDADARLSVLGMEIGGIKASVEEAKKSFDAANAQLVMRLEALEKKAAEPRDDVNVAVAIASAGLKAAIDRGGPFITELDTLEGIDAQDPAVQELKKFAAIGVPSRSTLIASFPNAADRILAAVHVDDPNQGLMDRLWASAFSSVKVRPVGNVEGDGPDAVVARIEAKLTDGDLKAAAVEWQALPEAAQKAAGDFKASLDARIRVEELVGSALTKAVSGTQTKG